MAHPNGAQRRRRQGRQFDAWLGQVLETVRLGLVGRLLGLSASRPLDFSAGLSLGSFFLPVCFLPLLLVASLPVLVVFAFFNWFHLRSHNRDTLAPFNLILLALNMPEAKGLRTERGSSQGAAGRRVALKGWTSWAASLARFMAATSTNFIILFQKQTKKEREKHKKCQQNNKVALFALLFICCCCFFLFFFLDS